MSDFTAWDAARVASWLEGLTPAFRRYKSRWMEDEVTGDMLPDLDDDTLHELGVASGLHRKRILRAVAELGGGATAGKASSSSSAVAVAVASKGSVGTVGSRGTDEDEARDNGETSAGSPAEKPGKGDTQKYATEETAEAGKESSPPVTKRPRLENLPPPGTWTRPAASSIDCPVCFCDTSSEEAVALEACGHAFCEECMTRYVQDKVKAGEVMPAQLVCPCVEPEKCGRPLGPAEVRRCLVDDASRERYERLTLQRYVDAEDDTGCCPTPGCALSFAWDEDNRKLECPLCNKTYCLVCRVEPWHAGVRCEEYQAEHGTGGDDDETFVAFAKKSKLRQCPKCRFFVEKTHGCDAMHCRCNLVFCYQCGGVRKSGTGFKQCKCPGVAGLLQAHEGGPNHNLLEFGNGGEEEDEDDDEDSDY